MNPETILPCPFCGETPNQYGKAVRCPTIGCVMAGCLTPIEAWNHRPPADWSAAAREICDKVLATLEAGGVKYTIRSEWYGEVEAIIRKHAQSQPSAPVREKVVALVDDWCPTKHPVDRAHFVDAIVNSFVQSSPVPSQEPAWDDKQADEIVSGLYRKFKDWSARGFTVDDVTWCEVKAEINRLIAIYAHPGIVPGWVPGNPQTINLDRFLDFENALHKIADGKSEDPIRDAIDVLRGDWQR